MPITRSLLMPLITPTSSSVRAYSGVSSKDSNTSSSNSLTSRQLPEEDDDALRVHFDYALPTFGDTSKSTSIFPSHPATVFANATEQFLNQTGNALEQLKAVAIRAAADKTTGPGRKELNYDAEQLVDLLDNIAENAILDNQQLLDGSISEVSFQVSLSEPTQKSIRGFNASTEALGLQPGDKQSTGDRTQLQESVSGNQGVQEGNARTNILSDISIYVKNQNINEAINITDQKFGGLLQNVANTSSITDPTHDDFGSGLAKDLASRVNTIREFGESTLTNIYATANTLFNSGDISSSDFSGTVDTSIDKNVSLGSLDRGDLSINGINVDKVTFLENDAAGTLVYAINALTPMTGVVASTDINTGELNLEASDGRDIVINTSTTETTNLLFGGGESRFTQNFNDLRVSGRVTLSANDELSFFGSSKSRAGLDEFSLDGTEENVSTTNTVRDTNLETQTNAKSAALNISQAIQQVDDYKEKLSALRSEFQSTLQAFGSIYQQPRENNTGISSTATASKLAEISRSIMQQRIDTAVQAQANADSKQVLFYLR